MVGHNVGFNHIIEVIPQGTSIGMSGEEDSITGKGEPAADEVENVADVGIGILLGFHSPYLVDTG